MMTTEKEDAKCRHESKGGAVKRCNVRVGCNFVRTIQSTGGKGGEIPLPITKGCSVGSDDGSVEGFAGSGTARAGDESNPPTPAN